MTKEQDAPTPVSRNSVGLRDALFDELDAIRCGKSSPARANAVAKIATGIVETVRMEMEVQRHFRNAGSQETKQETVGVLGSPLPLGNMRT